MARTKLTEEEKRLRIKATNAKNNPINNPKRSKAYIAWTDMKRRCDNPNVVAYKNYGARGISYCSPWREYVAFLSDMGEAPEGLSLGRIDNDGNYEPSNCRWETPKQQANNTRRSKKNKHAHITL